MAVLGATGATGRLLVSAALDRGLTVVALARDPARVPIRPGLLAVAADVGDPSSIAHALTGCDVLVSGLGVRKGSPPGVLSAGASAVAATGIERIVWLGALGTGPSARFAGPLTRTLLKVAMSAELPDKASADTTVLAAGGTVLHVGPLTGGHLSASKTVPLMEAPRRLFPSTVSRATVAAAMLDEAVHNRYPGQVVTLV
ncbi:MAG TPA: NAD(P)-binding oxidoreductase [Actinoplanes sp.]|nr:NAD(P)-binding oxidoreductase [Actinoplanes sp.]